MLVTQQKERLQGDDLEKKMTVYARDVIFNELDRLHCENTNDVLDENNVKLLSIFDCSTESDANDQSNVRMSVRDKNPPNRFGEWCIFQMICMSLKLLRKQLLLLNPNFGNRLCKEKLIQLIKIMFGL